MESSLLRHGELSETILFLEITRNIDDSWPKGYTFREVFVFHMPITKRLLEHVQRYSKQQPPKWMSLAYPEISKIIRKPEIKNIVHLNLETIMKFEEILNPNSLPYPQMTWLQQVYEADQEFENVRLKGDNTVEFSYTNEFFTAVLTITMTENFPFERPAFRGYYSDVCKWVNNKT